MGIVTTRVLHGASSLHAHANFFRRGGHSIAPQVFERDGGAGFM